MLSSVAVLAAACGASKPPAGPLKPGQIVPAPAGLIAGGEPQSNGLMWLLAGPANGQNLQEINLVTGAISKIVPVNAGATALVESGSGTLAVGYANGTVEYRSGTSGALLHSTSVGGPVLSLATGTGNTFFVLSGTSAAKVVTAVSSVGPSPLPPVGVPVSTIGVARAADNELYLLQDSGTVIDTSIGATGGTNAASSSFPVGSSPVAIALSPDGTTLFVLKAAGTAMNVGVFKVATEQQRKVIPAPAHSVDVVPSIDGRHVYVLVGTSTYANVQVFPVA